MYLFKKNKKNMPSCIIKAFEVRKIESIAKKNSKKLEKIAFKKDIKELKEKNNNDILLNYPIYLKDIEYTITNISADEYTKNFYLHNYFVENKDYIITKDYVIKLVKKLKSDGFKHISWGFTDHNDYIGLLKESYFYIKIKFK